MGKDIRLRSLEIFAGAGGLALGTALAGFEHVAVIESHNQECETLRRNKKHRVKYARDWEIVEADVGELDFTTYKKIDLLSGGPPCQPFSQGGKRSGRSDDRDMFPQFIRAVGECQPKTFLIENVKGLFDRSFSNYVNYILLRLRFPLVQRNHREKWTEHRARLEKLYTGGNYKGLQYKVISQVLNATDFGVAQRRQRVFIVGVREDLGIEYSFPLPTHTRESLWVSQWVDGTYWERHCVAKKHRPAVPQGLKPILPQLKETKKGRPWRTVRDAIADLPSVPIGRQSRKVLNHFFNPGARTYSKHSGSHLDIPAKTIKAGYNGVPGGENMVQLDDGRIRYFSVRECARLQTFPDNWGLEGSWCGCMRQLGNAVPVTLGKAVSIPLAEALSSKGV